MLFQLDTQKKIFLCRVENVYAAQLNPYFQKSLLLSLRQVRNKENLSTIFYCSALCTIFAHFARPPFRWSCTCERTPSKQWYIQFICIEIVIILTLKMELDGEFRINIKAPDDERTFPREIKSALLQINIEQEQRPPTFQTEIYCPLCERNPNSQKCIACRKTKYIDLKSNFSKFVTSIFNFKLGKSQQNLENKDDGYAYEAPSNITKPPSLVRTNYENSKVVVKMSDIEYKIALRSDTSVCCTHRNIKCNECDMFPIMGSRYVCRECQNYDLCEKCFDASTHQHNFEAVHESNYYKRKQKLRLHANTHKQLEDLGGGIMNLLNNMRNLI